MLYFQAEDFALFRVCFILLVSKAFFSWKYVPIYWCHLESTRYNTKLSFLLPFWKCTLLVAESCSRLSNAQESGGVYRSRGQRAVPLRAAARTGGMAVAGSAMAAAARGAAAGGRCRRCPGPVPSWRPWAAPARGRAGTASRAGSAPRRPHRVLTASSPCESGAVCAPARAIRQWARCGYCPCPLLPALRRSLRPGGEEFLYRLTAGSAEMHQALVLFWIKVVGLDSTKNKMLLSSEKIQPLNTE